MDSKSSKIKRILSDIFAYQETPNYDFTLEETKHEGDDSPQVVPANETTNKQIFTDIDSNLKFVETKYSKEINSDIQIREFSITVKNKLYKSFLLYIDGMVDSDIINNYILKPLMLRNTANTFDQDVDSVSTNSNTENITIKKQPPSNISEYISNCLLPQNSVKDISNFKKLFADINSGNCALFVDTLNIAFDIEVKGFKQRSIESPKNEVVIRGSQESFNEVIRTNTSLLRRVVNNEDLIIENISVGSLSNTSCAVCYMKSIANDQLVKEVKYRLNNIEVDYLISSGQLEQLITDNSRFSLPQSVATERPDKVSHYLLEGRVAIIVNGSPYVLVVPGTFIDFLVSPEDKNLKFQYANLSKIIRLICLLITLFTPGIYVAIAHYHQELIPTELLFAIVASRVAVPFPIIAEIVVMEFSFELIREARSQSSFTIRANYWYCWGFGSRASSCRC